MPGRSYTVSWQTTSGIRTDLGRKAKATVVVTQGDSNGGSKNRKRMWPDRFHQFDIKPERCAQCQVIGDLALDAACQIRGPLDAPKFKDYILPLIFLKRLSDVFDDEVQRVADEVG